MRKSDGPPRAVNNLRDLHTRWVSLQNTPTPTPPRPHTHTHARPPLRKIHSGYVNGNVITQPWRIYGPVHTHTNVFMTVSRALCKLILTGARTRLLGPLPRQLSAAAPVAALRLEGCRRTFRVQPRRSRSCCPTSQAVVRGVSVDRFSLPSPHPLNLPNPRAACTCSARDKWVHANWSLCPEMFGF